MLKKFLEVPLIEFIYSCYNLNMKYISFVLVFLLSACSVKNYETTQPKLVFIKSPKIKFADIGYLRNTDSSIELEMFMAGHAIEKISINHLICVRAGCMTKSGFNQEYLNHSYPDDILQNIFLGREIFDGKSKLIQEDGFVQKIDTPEVNISYKVNSKQIFFKDTKNKILIKLKDTK